MIFVLVFSLPVLMVILPLMVRDIFGGGAWEIALAYAQHDRDLHHYLCANSPRQYRETRQNVDINGNSQLTNRLLFVF